MWWRTSNQYHVGEEHEGNAESLPRVDLCENLLVRRISVLHERPVFDTEAILPKRQVANSGFCLRLCGAQSVI